MFAQRIAAALPRGRKVRAAKAIGVSPSAITNWTREEKPALPDWPFVVALMDWLGLPEDERKLWEADWIIAKQGGSPAPFAQGRWVFLPAALAAAA